MFIKLGKSYLNANEIVAINTEYLKVERGMWKDGEDTVAGNKKTLLVRVVSNGSVIHDFEHDTPEADALLKWLEGNSEVLLA